MDEIKPAAVRSAGYTVVTNAAGVAEMVEELSRGTGAVAVDTERASGFRYSQRAYLLQLFRRGSGVFLIDPIALGPTDFAGLGRALAEPEWVLHAASQDLPSLRELGLDPKTIFDTELAARLLGYERVGLGAVVQHTLGIQLEKAHSAADWSTRPLPEDWLDYAALDVELLIDVRDALEAELRTQGKHEFALEEFAAVLAKPAKKAPAEPWRRLSGLSAVRDPRRLAVARALWQARDEFAQEIDMAPGRVIPDSALVALAQALPSSRGAMVAVTGFNGRYARSQVERWWAAIEAGRHSAEVPSVKPAAEPGFPAPRHWNSRNPLAAARLALAREAVGELAAVMKLPVENLLTPDTLRALAWQPPRDDEDLRVEEIVVALRLAGARSWQIDATAEVVRDAFVAAHQSGHASLGENS